MTSQPGRSGSSSVTFTSEKSPGEIHHLWAFFVEINPGKPEFFRPFLGVRNSLLTKLTTFKVVSEKPAPEKGLGSLEVARPIIIIPASRPASLQLNLLHQTLRKVPAMARMDGAWLALFSFAKTFLLRRGEFKGWTGWTQQSWRHWELEYLPTSIVN